MFCSECGAAGVEGKFCSNCGSPVTSVVSSSSTSNSAVTSSLVFGRPTNASSVVIDICEASWPEGFEDEDSLTSKHFLNFTSGDWGALSNYLNEKYSYPYTETYYEEFIELYKTGSQVREQSLDFSEYLGEVVSNFIDSLDPNTDQLKLLIAAGFLGNLPYPVDWSGSGFWPQKAEHITKELEVIFDVLQIGKPGSLLGHNLDPLLDVLNYMSDFGVSALLPHLGSTQEQKKYLQAFVKPGHFHDPAITMSSLLYFITPAGSAEDIGQMLISPRTIHLLFDDGNFIPPWWIEMGLWNTADLASGWKEFLPGSVTELEPWKQDRVIELIKNALNPDLYNNEETFGILMQDREIYENLLEFLES